MTKTEKLLCELIALPSVNPAFLPAHHPRAGEQRVAEYLVSFAARAGLDVEFQPVAPGRSNLLVRLLPQGPVRWRILLAPHLDTVNGSDEQFTPHLTSTRIYGRGACDTKASAAAMLLILCDLARSGRRPRETELVFAGLADEENAQLGSRALAKSGFKADLAIIGEATRLQVVTAHKGTMWLGVETRGRSAHGSRPELGLNAVHSMARVVELIETTYAARLRKRRHPLLGAATVNVGTIAGGTQPNIVPDRCSIRIDRRTLPGETEASVERELRALLRQAGLPARVWEEKVSVCSALETDARRPLVKQFLQSAKQKRPAGVHFFCDAAVLSEAGIPSVVFGPGDIAQAHTADEWLARSALERGRQLLERFLSSLP